MISLFKLGATTILPVITSAVLYKIYNREQNKNMSNTARQIITGVIFGILAIIATEFGVSITDATINVRIGSVMSAGLIFGAPAGIIAGLIGGIERWFASYWGAGYATRLACSLSTIIIGFLIATFRKLLFNDSIPKWNQALPVATTCSVLDMLMIFLTNTSNPRWAFSFVKSCSLPMIVANTICVVLSVYVISRLRKNADDISENKTGDISSQFLRALYLTMINVLIFTSLIFLVIQLNLSKSDTEFLLRNHLFDAITDVEDQCDSSLLDVNEKIVKEFQNDENIDLNILAEQYNIADINIIDDTGIITGSNNDKYVGFNMYEGEQSKEFIEALKSSPNKSYVQDFMPTAANPDESKKFSGIDTGEYIIQISFDADQLHNTVTSLLSSVAKNRHISEKGQIVVLDESNNIVSATDNGVWLPDNFNPDLTDKDEGELYSTTGLEDDNYYMFYKTEGYKILGFLPVSEAHFSRDLSLYLNVFTQAIVFGILFVIIFVVVKETIVYNVQKVNTSLQKITSGNLDTVVDVRSNEEFVSLSDGINETVDALKMYIKQANERIDAELKYASEIQFSALPHYFPENKEYQIYALMDPAKEVGGDFYDFYLLNNSTLVFLVADVAGKGIPASLFMMRAKTIIKTYAENGINVADIFTNANYNLCEGNDAGMFVTSWMGFLNLETGELRYVNAGHNRPLLKRKNQKFEYLTGPAGFVLGGMDGIVYKEQNTVLEPGDEIFLYTDGVVEATDLNTNLYGDQRLLDCLNNRYSNNAKQLCDNVLNDVETFYGEAPQFDDITELSLKFKGYLKQ